MRKFLMLASLVAATGLSSGANAAVGPITVNAPTTIYFYGSCTDCALAAGAPVTALADMVFSSYVLDVRYPTYYTNFSSFHYYGTNLIPGGFTITNPSQLSGGISQPLPAAENFTVGNSSYTFQTNSAGVWSVSKGNVLADVGTGGTYSLSAPVSPSAVPEAATWAMIIVGFGLVGTALRQRRQATVRFASGAAIETALTL